MSLQIVDLRQHGDLIDRIAHWHQQEFGYLNPDRTVAQRIERLRPHLTEAMIPSTFVALDNGETVGSASLVADDMSIRPELTPWLAGVFVTPDRRRRGIGRALVQRVVEAARTAPFETLYLYTTDRVAFYQWLGWRIRERLIYRGELVTVMSIDIERQSAGPKENRG